MNRHFNLKRRRRRCGDSSREVCWDPQGGWFQTFNWRKFGAEMHLNTTVAVSSQKGKIARCTITQVSCRACVGGSAAITKADLMKGRKNAIKAGNLSLKGTMIAFFVRGLHMMFFLYPAE